jgi:hypothetical protein
MIALKSANYDGFLSAFLVTRRKELVGGPCFKIRVPAASW